VSLLDDICEARTVVPVERHERPVVSGDASNNTHASDLTRQVPTINSPMQRELWKSVMVHCAMFGVFSHHVARHRFLSRHKTHYLVF
jgi:hypothetical protein